MNKMFDVVEKSKLKNYYHTHFTTLSSPEEVLTAVLRSMKRVGGSSARIIPNLQNYRLAMEIVSNKKDVHVEIVCEIMKLSRGYYMVNFSRENG